MNAYEYIGHIEGEVMEGLRRHRGSFWDLAGALRGIRIDVKITPEGNVRAVIVQTETEMRVIQEKPKKKEYLTQ